MKNQILSIVSLLFLSTSAYAVSNVCELEKMPIDQNLGMSQNVIDSYRKKLNQECAIYKKSVEIRNEARNYGIELENIYSFQALRFIDRYAYNKGKATDMPAEFIFQVRREDANLPLAQRSDLVWRNWTKGIGQLSKTVSDLQQGVKLDVSYIQKIHIGFFAENEAGDMGNVVTPGELKKGRFPTVAFDINSQSELDRITAVAKAINQNLAELGLRPQMPAEDEYVNNILDVRDGKLYPAAPYAVRKHIENMLTFLNYMLDQARSNNHMIWKDRIFTPNELAYFIQQYIVQIHGFHDGNGRTSRFWQDAILAVFDFPAGNSADLGTNDMTSTQSDYYRDAVNKGQQELLNVEKCFTKVYPKLLPKNWKETGLTLRSIDANQITYDCRLLK